MSYKVRTRSFLKCYEQKDFKPPQKRFALFFHDQPQTREEKDSHYLLKDEGY